MKTTITIQLCVALALGSLALAAEKSDPDAIFNGKDFGGWRQPVGEWITAKSVTLSPTDKKDFTIEPGSGIMVNSPKGRTVNILTAKEFGDVVAHVEFVVPEGSNSGVYFQGRYEIQVFDSWGVRSPKYSDCGGIYERWENDRGFEGRPPRINASKQPGQWQSFDVIFRAPRFDKNGKKIENARFVKVIHNGHIVHENAEVTGPTRASHFQDEKPLGPLMLQGDHGPVAYRNLKIKSIKLD